MCWCSVLQYGAACCSVLLCCRCLKAYCVSVQQCGAVCWCSVLQCVAVCCSVLQCAAVCCSVFDSGSILSSSSGKVRERSRATSDMPGTVLTIQKVSYSGKVHERSCATRDMHQTATHCNTQPYVLYSAFSTALLTDTPSLLS